MTEQWAGAEALPELAELNEKQRQAVTATEGYVRVVAGAGSGKTRALAHRFAYLVNVLGVLPSHILCVTFTNKSANEMRRRIQQLSGDSAGGYISTFHGFCVSVLQEDAHILQYPESFLVLDNNDINAMLELIYAERGLTLRQMNYTQARDMIEMRKVFSEPHYFLDMIAMPLDILRQKYLAAVTPANMIFYGYLYQQKKCFGLDYNDLLRFTLHLFQIDEEAREKWQQRLEYIMIDEFQDIDQIQYDLMRALCGHHQNLFVVGDPDQTVYTWRGADTRYLLNFPQVFPHTQTIMMTENYRSAPEILAAANCLIRHNKQRLAKDLQPVLPPSGQKPLYYHAQNAAEEGAWIAAQIKSLLAAGASPADVAVLYRSHFVSRSIEEAFLQEGIPYRLYNGVQFYDRAEIKDALSYLRLLAFGDDLSLERVLNKPRRNLGRQRLEWLRSTAAEQSCSLYQALNLALEEPLFAATKAAALVTMVEELRAEAAEQPVSELLAAVLERSGYEEALRTAGDNHRLDNLAELKQAIYEFETSCGEETNLAGYLRQAALFAGADQENRQPAVKLMTVHTAKGLEFPYVFLCSLEEMVFPAKKTATQEAMEEERRLCFVALTRAERGLYLTDSEGRNLDGSCRFPSRFILNIDKDLLNCVREPEETLLRQARQGIEWSQRRLPSAEGAALFALGTRIYHPVFGRGEILEADGRQGFYRIRFDNLASDRRLSLTAPLEEEK